MNLSEIIITMDQLPVFIVILVICYTIFYYLKSIIPTSINVHPVIFFILLYVIFLIINRIINTNISFSKPLTQYLIRKKNFREEPYHINYVNPFVTNLDKVDFNMKKRQNKEYTKKILSQLLIRKYVTFQNVLGYISNPWETIKLKLDNNSTKYIVNDENKNTANPPKDNNMYCRNFLHNDLSRQYSMLLLYRKHVLKFMGKRYFIFEKKNKQHSKYFLRECISQVNIPSTSGETYTIIDTRDLYYDRQYILFEDLPKNEKTPNKWGITETYTGKSLKDYNKFKDDPVKYHWQNDATIHDVIVVDIHFIYNQLTVLDEDIMDKSQDKKDFALNKYYEKQSWMEKKYYNFIKYQFINRIGTDSVNVSAKNLEVFKNDNVNDATTVKFRKTVGNKIDYNTTFINNTNPAKFELHLNKTGAIKDYLEIKLSSGTPSTMTINFMGYIREYLQGKPEKPANELVIVKDKNTKFSEENDLILDKNTISYISFDFLNIRSIKEYRDKMNYIANSIVDKYYQEEVSSIDNIKYNIESLQIIQLDNLFRYNKGRSRLVLNNRVITPNNIGLYFKDIKKLRLAYQAFLERVLKYKQTLTEKIDKQQYSLNVTNNELLSILNNNPFNTKSKYLCQIEKIDKLETTTAPVTSGDDQYDKNLNNKRPLTTGTLVRLKLEEKTFRKPKKNPLFVKFATTMNINSFNINPDKIYIVHYIRLNNILKPQYICLEQYLLEPDVSGNITKIVPPTGAKKLTNSINLFDCTNMFRKENIGVSNLITMIDKNKFKVVFDNTPLEFKPLVIDTSTSSSNMYVDRPNYVMLNFSKNNNINEIKSQIYENQLYKVINIQSTTSNASAELTLESIIDIDYDTSTSEPQNNIFKNILVSQFINSKNYIENVFFKKVEIPRQDRLLSDGPSYKFVIELKKQIININPEITRNDIIDDYTGTMNRIIDLIYENEARKIHYEIPENIGIFKDTSAAVYSYKYKNNLYITYDKRNNPVNLFKNYSSEFLCKKVYRGNNFAVNMNSLYYLDSYQEYYKYFINLFKNTLGLHDEINYQCNEYYKSGSMLSNLKLPITFNKYVSFLNNYMLYYKSNIKIDDIDSKLLGKHVVINNSVCDNQLINVQNSNRLNSRLYKTFLQDFIYRHEIGRKGFEYDDAKKICERIFTVYDKNCNNKIYKNQPEKQSDYNIEYYKHNKERDKCFTTLYNDEKEKNTYQFIADSKILDPTNTTGEVDQLAGNIEKLKALKNTCSAKLTQDTCVADPNCFYSNDKCETLFDSDLPKIYTTPKELESTDEMNSVSNIIMNTVPPFEVSTTVTGGPPPTLIEFKDSSKIINDIPVVTECMFTKDITIDTGIPLLSGTINTPTTGTDYNISGSGFATNSGYIFAYFSKPIPHSAGTINAGEVIKITNVPANTYTLRVYTRTDATSGTWGSAIKSAGVSQISGTWTQTIGGNIKITSNHFEIEENRLENKKPIYVSFSQEIFINSSISIKANEIVCLNTASSANDIVNIYHNIKGEYVLISNSRYGSYIENNFKGTWTVHNTIKAFTSVYVINLDTTNKKFNVSLIPNNNSQNLKNSIPENTKVYFNKYIFESNNDLSNPKYIKGFKNKNEVYKLNANGNKYFSIYQKQTKTDDGSNYNNVPNSSELTLLQNLEFANEFKSITQSSKEDNSSVDYKSIVQEVERSGNLRFFPHRLAHLNEIKTAAYYGADWDSIGWINDSNPMLENKSNLVKVKDKKVLWVDPNDENAINKGVVCYGRKLDQDKLGANQRNEMFNFQMEKVEQSIKDIQKYENVSDFNKEVYSRWNL